MVVYFLPVRFKDVSLLVLIITTRCHYFLFTSYKIQYNCKKVTGIWDLDSRLSDFFLKFDPLGIEIERWLKANDM